MQVKNLALALFVTVAPLALAGAQSDASQPSSRTSINANYGKLPLTFEANHGQSDPQVRFIAHGPGYAAFLTKQLVTIRYYLLLRSCNCAGTTAGKVVTQHPLFGNGIAFSNHAQPSRERLQRFLEADAESKDLQTGAQEEGLLV